MQSLGRTHPAAGSDPGNKGPVSSYWAPDPSIVPVSPDPRHGLLPFKQMWNHNQKIENHNLMRLSQFTHSPNSSHQLLFVLFFLSSDIVLNFHKEGERDFHI